MNHAVVIPSCNIQNLSQCLQALRRTEDDSVERVIVWDASHGGEIPAIRHAGRLNVVFDPFIFARNVNIGIRIALETSEWKTAGVTIINDDALLQTPGGFSLLAQAAAEHPEFGIIAATTNVVGNPNQFNKGIGLREEDRMVCFVAVYIPRTTIEKVGLLDERFSGYGLDDDDYSLRVRKAGLKLGIHDGCVVDHGSLKSTYRGDPTTPADYRPNLEIFKQKWGVDNFGNPA